MPSDNDDGIHFELLDQLIILQSYSHVVYCLRIRKSHNSYSSLHLCTVMHTNREWSLVNGEKVMEPMNIVAITTELIDCVGCKNTTNSLCSLALTKNNNNSNSNTANSNKVKLSMNEKWENSNCEVKRNRFQIIFTFEIAALIPAWHEPCLWYPQNTVKWKR